MTEKLYPDNFIKGQKALETLLTEVKNNTVSHSYILEGPKGVGKKTAAAIFAAALHCTGEDKPCGVCGQCVKHIARTHPDVMLLEPEENGSIKIDAVRAASDELFMRPKLSKRKILIIDGADGMNPAAQNALLKSFEEPPDYGVVVLLSENSGNLLPTIRSRGVKLRMEPFPLDKVKEYVIKEFPAFAEKSDFVARCSFGIVGRARDICDSEEYFAFRKEVFEAVGALSGSKSSVFTAAEAFGYKSKPDAETKAMAFDMALSFLRDALMLKNGGSIINTDCAEEISDFSAKASMSGIIRAIDCVTDTMTKLNVSMNYDLWIINMLIECWGDLHGNGSRS